MDQIQFETMTSDVSFHSLWNPPPSPEKTLVELQYSRKIMELSVDLIQNIEYMVEENKNAANSKSSTCFSHCEI